MADSPQPIHHDTPAPAPASEQRWGSDAIAAMLRALDIPYLALNPGASYRGLHDSLVNHLGNRSPQMLLCLHEENAVSLAHGYAKASDRLMGAVLHSNVGLMHASMSVFNAWCDRTPMLLLGATGPVDSARRRPWIDWIHTTSDQGALVRDYTKWDNQPASVPAACEALARAVQIAQTAPRGPTYVNLDAAVQEAPLNTWPTLPDPSRHAPPPPVAPAETALAQAVALLDAAQRPVILAGRCSRNETAWAARVALAEACQARVITDLKIAAAFPTAHELHAGPPGHFLAPEVAALLREADVVLALDWVDLAGTLRQAWGDGPVSAQVIHVSPDAHLHRGWSHDYQALPVADVYLMCEPEAVVPLLGERVRTQVPRAWSRTAPALQSPRQAPGGVITLSLLSEAFDQARAGEPVSLTRLPLGWNGAWCRFDHPLDYLGLEGGGGVGAGPGITIGAALALRGSGRTAVGIMGDGDFLMGNTALWTAAHYGIGCLMVVANNRSFFNDEVHQERVAHTRGRPVENKWIGQRIDRPDIDLAMMARSQGARGIGPVTDPGALPAALREGLQAARRGEVVLVDVRVLPGYDGSPSGAPASSQRK